MPPAYEPSHVIQMLVQIQKDIAKLETKVERLISDVAGHGEHINGITHQASFIKGAVWVLGALFTIATLLFSYYVNGRFTELFNAIAALAK